MPVKAKASANSMKISGCACWVVHFRLLGESFTLVSATFRVLSGNFKLLNEDFRLLSGNLRLLSGNLDCSVEISRRRAIVIHGEFIAR